MANGMDDRGDDDCPKGPWTSEEDEILRGLVDSNGARNWSRIAECIPGRSGKSCRLRWLNQLSPEVKTGPWEPDEDAVIIWAHLQYGNKWCVIAKHLPGRTDNHIKNRWNCTLRKRLLGVLEILQTRGMEAAADAAETAAAARGGVKPDPDAADPERGGSVTVQSIHSALLTVMGLGGHTSKLHHAGGSVGRGGASARQSMTAGAGPGGEDGPAWTSGSDEADAGAAAVGSGGGGGGGLDGGSDNSSGHTLDESPRGSAERRRHQQHMLKIFAMASVPISAARVAAAAAAGSGAAGGRRHAGGNGGGGGGGVGGVGGNGGGGGGVTYIQHGSGGRAQADSGRRGSKRGRTESTDGGGTDSGQDDSDEDSAAMALEQLATSGHLRDHHSYNQSPATSLGLMAAPAMMAAQAPAGLTRDPRVRQQLQVSTGGLGSLPRGGGGGPHAVLDDTYGVVPPLPPQLLATLPQPYSVGPLGCDPRLTGGVAPPLVRVAGGPVGTVVGGSPRICLYSAPAPGLNGGEPLLSSLVDLSTAGGGVSNSRLASLGLIPGAATRGHVHQRHLDGHLPEREDEHVSMNRQEHGLEHVRGHYMDGAEDEEEQDQDRYEPPQQPRRPLYDAHNGGYSDGQGYGDDHDEGDGGGGGGSGGSDGYRGLGVGWQQGGGREDGCSGRMRLDIAASLVRRLRGAREREVGVEALAGACLPAGMLLPPLAVQPGSTDGRGRGQQQHAYRGASQFQSIGRGGAATLAVGGDSNSGIGEHKQPYVKLESCGGGGGGGGIMLANDELQHELAAVVTNAASGGSLLHMSGNVFGVDRRGGGDGGDVGGGGGSSSSRSVRDGGDDDGSIGGGGSGGSMVVPRQLPESLMQLSSLLRVALASGNGMAAQAVAAKLEQLAYSLALQYEPASQPAMSPEVLLLQLSAHRHSQLLPSRRQHIPMQHSEAQLSALSAAVGGKIDPSILKQLLLLSAAS